MNANLIPLLQQMLKWTKARENAERNSARGTGKAMRRYGYWTRQMGRCARRSRSLSKHVTPAEWQHLRACARKLDAKKTPAQPLPQLMGKVNEAIRET